MPLLACLRCGRLSRSSYRPRHQPQGWRDRPSPSSLDRPPAAIVREARERGGYHCAVCGSTERLRVHHLRRVADGGLHVQENLVILTCRRASSSCARSATEPSTGAGALARSSY